MSEVKSINVSLVFVFIKNKSKMTYSNVFEFIKKEINFESPDMIKIDFEMEAVLAFKEIFTESKFQGYFYIFTTFISKSTAI